jgi:hypothetical protein
VLEFYDGKLVIITDRLIIFACGQIMNDIWSFFVVIVRLTGTCEFLLRLPAGNMNGLLC